MSTNMVSGDVMLHLQSLSPSDIQGIRHSWGLAKDAAPFEVHGPAFYRLYEWWCFISCMFEQSFILFKECLGLILHGDLTSTTWEVTYLWMTIQSYKGTWETDQVIGVKMISLNVNMPGLWSTQPQCSAFWTSALRIWITRGRHLRTSVLWQKYTPFRAWG